MEKYFEINEEGHNIRCKLYYDKLPEIKRVIIFCHGFAGHMDNNSAKKFAEKITAKYKGTALVTFNWPCHGNDVKKKLTLDYCDTYLRLVLSFVKEQFHTEEIYGYGTSFGGYLILKYIYEHGSPFKRIALRCPALNMYDSFMNVILKDDQKTLLEKGKPAKVGFDRLVEVTNQFVDELRENDITQWDFLPLAYDIVIIHGTCDEVIPFEISRDFAEKNLIEFYPAEGADHRFQMQRAMDFCTKTIVEFFGL